MPLNQTRHEVLPPIAPGPLALPLDLERPPLRHLLLGDARDEVVGRVQRRDVLADWVAPQEDVELGHLADNAVVLLAVVDGADRVLLVQPRGEEPERPPEGHLAEHVEGEVVQPVAQVQRRVRRLLRGSPRRRLLGRGARGRVRAEAAHARHEQLDRVVDEGAELAHGRHGVRDVGHLLLHSVDLLTYLSEDVRVLGRREDAVKVRLVEPLAGREHVPGDLGRGEGDLVGPDADHGAVFPV